MAMEGQVFADEIVTLDGKHYVGCTMERCTLEYHGRGPVALTDCTIDGSHIAYRGAALTTVQTLQAIAKSGPDGLDHVMRLFLPHASMDWKALASFGSAKA